MSHTPNGSQSAQVEANVQDTHQEQSVTDAGQEVKAVSDDGKLGLDDISAIAGRLTSGEENY